MDRFIDKLRSIKNENDLYKIKLSYNENDLIKLLSIVSYHINNKNNTIKFIYDHLKLLIKRKLILISNPSLYEIEPEIWVNNILSKYPKKLLDTINFFRIELPISFSLDFRSKLEKVKTIGGGTCLLHAILLGLSPTLQTLNNENYYIEELGNAYRLFLGSKKSLFNFDDEEIMLLNNKGILNDSTIWADLQKWKLPDLDILIGFKLLDKLRYNLINIGENLKKKPYISTSPYNKLNQQFIIIYNRGLHFELIKKKNTLKTIYNKTDLLDIFSMEILNFEID